MYISMKVVTDYIPNLKAQLIKYMSNKNAYSNVE